MDAWWTAMLSIANTTKDNALSNRMHLSFFSQVFYTPRTSHLHWSRERRVQIMKLLTAQFSTFPAYFLPAYVQVSSAPVGKRQPPW